eukprot:CAMPEP_0176014928 /NCGR_PEP_ID=MMETSP0120_2-20121206/7074_1 /TAXON_ID=160619 /ORGANISM="Kryptoperidinium foliaceum, Strain CCMP 1326" /LENGTH=329 /DNA_ID=CAMNT_0017347881 /DNA_START=487 /DNA_END=1476 /DNA_ORIENTATION=-
MHGKDYDYSNRVANGYGDPSNQLYHEISRTGEINAGHIHHLTDSQSENLGPILLLLVGALSSSALLVAMVSTLPGGGQHKEYMVPMNVSFAIHRWGEFTMLVLGESVLSLLIVDVVESAGYFKTFFSGVISITLLEFLHFRSQPHRADDHAIRRSKEAGIVFTSLMQIYSASLVVLGTSYKMLLYEHVHEANKLGDSRRVLSNPFARLLVANAEPNFELADRQQREAQLFCISMAVVWACSDLMIVNHRGLKDNFGRCRFSHAGVLRLVGSILVLLRVGLICFIATLSQWVTQPSLLAFVGLMGIFTQVCLRVIGSVYFGPVFRGDSNV